MDRVGACDFSELVRDDALLDSPMPDRASLALTFHPFPLLVAPPLTDSLPPPELQPAECYAQTLDSPEELLTPSVFVTCEPGLTRCKMT
eukprot:5974850-Pleurochrysis_carterae.AAC.1